MEALLARLASRFVAVGPEGLEAALNESLAQLGEFSRADRVYLFHYDPGADTITNTHEWCAAGVSAEQQALQNLPFDGFPWFKDQLLRGERIRINDVSVLPAEAAAERAELERESIRSLLLAPLSDGGDFVGFMGVDFVARLHAWAEADVRLLCMAGELIANTIGRIRAVEMLRRSEAGLTAAQRIAHLGNWDWNIVTGELAWSDEIYRIFGLEPQQFGATYAAFLDAVHPDDRAFVVDNVDRAVAGGAAYAIDHRIVRSEGTVAVVHEKGDTIRDAGGRPLRMIGTVQDVTEACRGEHELRRLNRALRTLSLCNTTLVHAEDEQQLMDAIGKALADAGGYRFAWVGYAEDDARRSIRPLARAGQGDRFLDTLEASRADGPAGDLPAGFAIRPLQVRGAGARRGAADAPQER